MATSKKRPLEPLDTTILTEADKARIAKKAADQVHAEKKKVVESALFAELLREEKSKTDQDQIYEDVVINIPAYATYLLIDGNYYNHGEHVTVTKAVGDSLRDNMARMWEHEHISGNPNMREYKPVKEAPSVSALARM